MADPSSLLEEVASDRQLLAAWQAVREGDAEDGDLSRGVRRFDKGAIDRIQRLRQRLLDRTWRPERAHFYQRPDGRELTISAVPDRIVERSLTQVLTPVVDPLLSPFSFAYRKGLGTRDALNALRESLLSGWTHVVRTDVQDAFDSVPRRRALNRLAVELPDNDLVDLVRHLFARLPGGMDGTGIPQGCAVSPLLLNLYLNELDEQLLREGFLPIRYADDLAVPVDGELSGLEVLDMIADVLADLGLQVNDGKTRIVAYDVGVDFLGQRVRPVGDVDALDGNGHPRRISMYATGPGGLLRLSKQRVRFDRQGQTQASLGLNRIRQIVVGGRTGITTPLLHEAASRGVDVVLVSQSGGFVGRVGRRRGGDVRIRQAQYRAADDRLQSLELAKGMVGHKIANMRVAILRNLRRKGEAVAAHSFAVRQADALERAASHVRKVTTVAALMGVEGAATRGYFLWLSREIPEAWGFTGRNRRPPRDPVNAMLSFGYTLLSAELISACEIAGLDPDLGFLHSPRWGRPSLALDLMEQWRTVLVDTMVLGLLRRSQVRPEGFFTDPDKGCRMTDDTRRTLLEAYEKRMLTLGSDPGGGGRRAYRELLAVYAHSFASALLDPTDAYTGYRWR